MKIGPKCPALKFDQRGTCLFLPYEHKICCHSNQYWFIIFTCLQYKGERNEDFGDYLLVNLVPEFRCIVVILHNRFWLQLMSSKNAIINKLLMRKELFGCMSTSLLYLFHYTFIEDWTFIFCNFTVSSFSYSHCFPLKLNSCCFHSCPISF